MQTDSPATKQADTAKTVKTAKLSELFGVFAKIGLFTVGGGAVMLPLIQRAVVEEKAWLNQEEYADMITLTNSAPGAFTINASIYIGYTQRGLIGATAAMLGMVTPSIIIIIILAYMILQGRNVSWLQQFFAGVRPIVAALLLDAALKIRKTMLKSRFDLILVALGLAMILLAGLNSVFVIVSGAVIAVLYNKLANNKNTASDLNTDSNTNTGTSTKEAE